METHNVRHYLHIYATRKEMQEAGLTDVSEEMKEFTKKFVEKLKALPLEEKIILIDKSFYTGNGQLVASMP